MQICKVGLDEIKVGENFSREELGDLASLMVSMENHGLQQPVIVDRSHNLVAGFRRYHSARKLGWAQIDVVYTDQDPRMVNLTENLERQSLTFYEEARAIHHLFPDCTDIQVAESLGRTAGWSRPRNKLFTLPQPIIDKVKTGQVSINQVTMILNARDRNEMIDHVLNGTAPKYRKKPGKKQIQQTITIALERELPDVAHALRYAIGNITEEEFWDEVQKDG